MNPIAHFFRQLKERNVRKTLAIYMSAALTTVGVIKLFMEVYEIPPAVFSVTVTILTIGTINAFVHAWQSGGTQTKRSRNTGIALHSFLIVIALVLSYRNATSTRSTVSTDGSASVIAVLPFANLNKDADEDYFSDGITEDILTHLSKIADLKVISRTSVMQYKNTTKPIREIAGELGAGSILEGSVRRAGSQIRIVAKLINARTDENLWGETYNREVTDVFEIQSDVAQQIARALKARLSPAESTRIGHRPTGNLDAYTYYLRGRDLYYRYTMEDNEQAIAMFNQAIAADPNYALALAGLADAYAQRVQRFGFEQNWADTAIEISHAAIRIDPGIAEPYKSLGLAFAQREWYHKAMDQFSMALRINPNFSAAVSNLGLIHLWTGDPASGLPLIKKTLILSPERTIHYFHLASVYDAIGVDSLSERYYRRTISLDENSTFAYRALSQLYVVTGRIPQAMAMLDSVLSTRPDDSYLLQGAGEAELFAGKLDKAEQHYRAAVSALGGAPGPTTQIAFILLRKGKEAEAKRLLDESLSITNTALEDGSENYDHMIDRARVFSILGDTAQSIQWLERALNSGWMLDRLIELDPQLENVRKDTRFEVMVAALRKRIAEIRLQLTASGMLN